MLYEKVFRRIFRKWACDHDPVEVDKSVHKTHDANLYYFDRSYVYTHTTVFYKCSYCGQKSQKTTTKGEEVKRSSSWTYYR